MLLKRYRVQVVEPTVKQHLITEGKAFSWMITANSLESAWRKFCKQRFGALLPNPSDYDIRFDSTLEV